MTRLIVWVLLFWPPIAAAQTAPDCTRNPDKNQWFVRAGTTGDADGTKGRPFVSLADIERCSPAGATITVLPALGAAPLDGGIRPKDRQKLLGVKLEVGQLPARLTNTTGTGDAITLAHGNEVGHLHIESPAGAGIFGDNVKRRAPARPAADAAFGLRAFATG